MSALRCFRHAMQRARDPLHVVLQNGLLRVDNIRLITHQSSLNTAIHISDHLEMKHGTKNELLLANSPADVLEASFTCSNGKFIVTCGGGNTNDFSGAHVLSTSIKYGKDAVGVISVGDGDNNVHPGNSFVVSLDEFDELGPDGIAAAASEKLRHCMGVVICLDLDVLDWGMSKHELETLSSSIRTTFGSTICGISVENCNNKIINLF